MNLMILVRITDLIQSAEEMEELTKMNAMQDKSELKSLMSENVLDVSNVQEFKSQFVPMTERPTLILAMLTVKDSLLLIEESVRLSATVLLNWTWFVVEMDKLTKTTALLNAMTLRSPTEENVPNKNVLVIITPLIQSAEKTKDGTKIFASLNVKMSDWPKTGGVKVLFIDSLITDFKLIFKKRFKFVLKYFLLIYEK